MSVRQAKGATSAAALNLLTKRDVLGGPLDPATSPALAKLRKLPGLRQVKVNRSRKGSQGLNQVKLNQSCKYPYFVVSLYFQTAVLAQTAVAKLIQPASS